MTFLLGIKAVLNTPNYSSLSWILFLVVPVHQGDWDGGSLPPRILHSALALKALQRPQQSCGIKFVSPCLWGKQGQGCTVEVQSCWGTGSKVGVC